jgi:hypothetical protein
MEAVVPEVAIVAGAGGLQSHVPLEVRQLLDFAFTVATAHSAIG